jgi:outer membrane protein assembly factor BamB
MTHAILLLALAAPPSYATAWGVISGDGKAVYLLHDKGFDALDAATGKPLWKAAASGRPIWAAGGIVISYGPGKGGMRLSGLDAGTGKPKWEKDVPMPGWVVVGNTPGRSFSAGASEKGGALFVSYRANSWYYGGARPTPEIEKAARKQDAATLKIDPTTGKYEKLAADKMPAAAPERRNGKVTFTVEMTPMGTVLRRKEDGKALPDVKLSDKPAAAFVGLDGKLALVYAGLSGKRVSWRAYDTATGKQAARFESATNYHTIDAVGGRAFAFTDETPRTRPFGTFARIVEAFDLKTGKALWSRKGESQTFSPPPP